MTYQGHSIAPSSVGLQNHSVGGTYPAIVVAYGDGTWGVDFAGHSIKNLSRSGAHNLAEDVGAKYRSMGYRMTVIYFVSRLIYSVANS